MTVARVTEIISGSKKGFEQAIEKGIERASKTVENIKSAWIKEQKVIVEEGKVVEYRVTMMITFILRE